MADSRARVGRESTSLKYLAVPENKEVLKECWGHVKRIEKPAGRGSHWLHLRQFDHSNKNDNNTPESLLCAGPCAWAVGKVKQLRQIY